jgi:hypothetical protein
MQRKFIAALDNSPVHDRLHVADRNKPNQPEQISSQYAPVH